MEKLALLFPGQGAQFIGMGKTFFDNYAIARQTFEEAGDIAGFDVAHMCFEGSLVQLNRAENLQPILLTVCTAMFRCYMEEINVRPFFCAGHSLGEYAALTCSGAISFPDAVRITRERGIMTQKMIEKDFGLMTILDQIEQEKAVEIVKPYEEQGVYIACYNSPSQVAVSGYHKAAEMVETEVLQADGQVTPLLASAPLHSPLMEELTGELKDKLGEYAYHMLKWPVISNVKGTPYFNVQDIPDILSNQLVKPVQWVKSIQFLQKFGVTMTIEIGPKNTLSKFVKEIAPEIKSFCYGENRDRDKIKEIFSEPLYTRTVPTVITKCLAAAAATPNENEDNVEYEEGVITNYRRLQQLQDSLEKNKDNPSRDQMLTALDWLKVIFKTKRLPFDEQLDWYHNIMDDTNTMYLLSEFDTGL